MFSNASFPKFYPTAFLKTQLYEFTGSTFQALTQPDDTSYVAEII